MTFYNIHLQSVRISKFQCSIPIGGDGTGTWIRGAADPIFQSPDPMEPVDIVDYFASRQNWIRLLEPTGPKQLDQVIGTADFRVLAEPLEARLAKGLMCLRTAGILTPLLMALLRLHDASYFRASLDNSPTPEIASPSRLDALLALPEPTCRVCTPSDARPAGLHLIPGPIFDPKSMSGGACLRRIAAILAVSKAFCGLDPQMPLQPVSKGHSK